MPYPAEIRSKKPSQIVQMGLVTRASSASISFLPRSIRCRDSLPLAPVQIQGFDGLRYSIGEGFISLECVGRKTQRIMLDITAVHVPKTPANILSNLMLDDKVIHYHLFVGGFFIGNNEITATRSKSAGNLSAIN
ncbi:hypothetical protein MMC22_007662, partial [Lobaria immixta]|nr:hypothetical protein [Lobaria immixta]